MTLMFWAAVAVMLAVALWLVLRPLLGGAGLSPELAGKLEALDAARKAEVIDEAEYAKKRAALGPDVGRALPVAKHGAFALAVLLPIAGLLGYSHFGRIDGLDPAKAPPPSATAASPHAGEGQNGGDMDEAIRGLAAKLAADPNDVEGWTLLSRALKQQQRFADSRDALQKARKIFPDDLDLAVEYAEALALNREDRSLEGEARELLEATLKKDPEHQRALWLLGIADAQRGAYPKAVATWEKLLALLPPDATAGDPIRKQIAEAKRLGGLAEPGAPTAVAAATPPKAAPAAPSAPAATAGGATLTVIVDISPELKAKVGPGDTLFVFARAPSGPKMPLAISKTTADKLPYTVTLTDGMGMMPTMTLSSVEQVVVGARISKSGNAFPQSGDLQVLTEPMATKGQKGPLSLVIKDVL